MTGARQGFFSACSLFSSPSPPATSNKEKQMVRHLLTLALVLLSVTPALAIGTAEGPYRAELALYSLDAVPEPAQSNHRLLVVLTSPQPSSTHRAYANRTPSTRLSPSRRTPGRRLCSSCWKPAPPWTNSVYRCGCECCCVPTPAAGPSTRLCTRNGPACCRIRPPPPSSNPGGHSSSRCGAAGRRPRLPPRPLSRRPRRSRQPRRQPRASRRYRWSRAISSLDWRCPALARLFCWRSWPG